MGGGEVRGVDGSGGLKFLFVCLFWFKPNFEEKNCIFLVALGAMQEHIPDYFCWVYSKMAIQKTRPYVRYASYALQTATSGGVRKAAWAKMETEPSGI